MPQEVIEGNLPSLANAVVAAKLNVIWQCDPMQATTFSARVTYDFRRSHDLKRDYLYDTSTKARGCRAVRASP